MFKRNAKSTCFSSLIVCLFLLSGQTAMWGQLAYGLGFRGPGYGTPIMALYDLDHCNMCIIKDLPFTGQDLLALPNGDVMLLMVSPNANPRYSYFETYSFPNTTPVNVSPNIPGRWFRSILDYNGQYYVTYLDSLYTIDLGTYQVTPIPGAIPLPAPPGPGTIIFRLFEYNGGLYAVYSPNASGSTFIMQIDPANASASSLNSTVNGLTNNLFTDVSTLDGQQYISGAAAPGVPAYGIGVFGFGMTPPTAAPFVCGANFPSFPAYPFIPFQIAPYGMVDAPANHPFFPCICANKAGEIYFAPSNRCLGSNQITVSVGVPGIPGNGDIIRYLVVTDTNNLAGSLIVSSASPIISVPPALIVPNVPYYLVMAVGNNINNSVDLSDPCLKLSNYQFVIWRPAPTVAFSVSNPNVCAGACTDITATFTGVPPFTLTY
ncbi:MAG: hypothetical protein WCR52_22775, partial [Bacteroidota bacterium]